MKGVLDSIELRMLRRADYLPSQFPTQYVILTAFRSCKRVTLQGCYALSYSLLSLAFATRWNPKQPSYVSTRLFCEAKISLYEIIKSINSETNDKPPGNVGLTAELYRLLK